MMATRCWQQWARATRSCALLLLLAVCHYCQSITCYTCNNEYGTCNGPNTCTGQSCVNIEQIHNGQRSVRKGCSPDYLETRCSSTQIGLSKMLQTKTTMIHCACPYDYCNGDEQLEQQLGLKEGLLANSAAPTAGTKASEVRRKTILSDDGSSYEIHERPLSLTMNHWIMLVFLCLFLSGSFSLLVMNTVCVHLC